MSAPVAHRRTASAAHQRAAAPSAAQCVLAEADGGRPRAVLVAVDGEERIALDARELLQREGIATRVVAVPSAQWLAAQSRQYQDSVIPPQAAARVSVASGRVLGWYAMLGPAGESVSLAAFGSRAPYGHLYQQQGLTAERVAAVARSGVRRAERGGGWLDRAARRRQR